MAQTFPILAKDVDDAGILFLDTFILRQRYVKGEHRVSLTAHVRAPPAELLNLHNIRLLDIRGGYVLPIPSIKWPNS